MNVRAKLTVLSVLVSGVLACGEAGGGAASGSAAAGKGDDKAPAAKTGDGAKADKKPTTTLTQKQVDDALKAAFGLERMSDPVDKKLADLESKIGKPAKKEGDSAYWYAIGEPKQTCYELKLSTKDGSYEMGGTDGAKCGL
jgi:hypothetical protein